MKKKTMKKLMAVLFATLLLTGCQSSKAVIITPEGQKDNPGAGKAIEQEDLSSSEQDKPNDEADTIDGGIKPVNQGITVNKIPFEVVDTATLSEQMLNEIETLRLQRGYAFWQQEDGSYLILVSAGEKLTGGYGIEVEAVEDNEGKTVISVKETEPEGDMNLQALTYPAVVIKAAGITEQFIIRDQNQNEYAPIAIDGAGEGDGSGLFDTVLRLSEDFENPVTGIYQGQIDNHSIEVLVGDEYMVFTADEIDRFLKGIQIGDQIEITRSISPSDQITVENIVKAR